MAGPPGGWAQMTRRLLWSTPWEPGRTIAFAGRWAPSARSGSSAPGHSPGLTGCPAPARGGACGPFATDADQAASWKTRASVCRSPDLIADTPWRTGAADHPRAERTGLSLVVNRYP